MIEANFLYFFYIWQPELSIYLKDYRSFDGGAQNVSRKIAINQETALPCDKRIDFTYLHGHTMVIANG